MNIPKYGKVYLSNARTAGRTTAMLAVIPLALSTSTLHAQEVTAYPSLPCEARCPQTTPAKQAGVIHPHFDAEQIESNQEGAVEVNFTVGKDGRTKNAMVEQIVGSPSFVKNALQQVLATSFEPATEDGSPVEENKRYRIIYTIHPSRKHPEVVQQYQEALSHPDKPADEIAALKAIEGRGEQNLYEATMIAAALAQLEAQSGDDRAALGDIEVATLDNARFLDLREQEQALRLQIVLEARAGQYNAAFETLETLKKLKGVTVSEDDPEARLISKLHAEVDSSKPLWANAEISANPAYPNWQHGMLRRSFGFSNIKGSLKGFQLRCQTHEIDSPVTESATWTIPPSWTKCGILVEGTPGTTFQFGEAQPDVATTQPK